MRLSYRKYPALLFADKDNINKSRLMSYNLLRPKLENPKSPEEYNEYWTWMKIMVDGIMLDKPIFLLSGTFIDALSKNWEKLVTLFNSNEDLRVECMEDCILINNVNKLWILHHLNENEFLFISKSTDEHDLCHVVEYIKDENQTCVLFTTNVEESFREFAAVLMVILFKKYATVELVTVEAGKKKKVEGVEHGKVLNEMGIDVTLLDSSWFREIIRNKGFKVRGHFRLQPCKDENGNWTRKIIYINEFEKHGYHRKAKINIEQETMQMVN